MTTESAQRRQDGAEKQRILDLREVSDVMIPVEDQDEAISFYTGTLSLELVADRPYGDGQRWVEVAPPEGRTALARVPSHGDYRAGSHTGVALATTDARATHRELKARRVDVDDEIMGGGDVPAFFWFRDQDGNTLMIVEGR
jgi:catechol 2,3-dioxygenase-like lactoylglutathione lyase family enzyme